MFVWVCCLIRVFGLRVNSVVGWRYNALVLVVRFDLLASLFSCLRFVWLLRCGLLVCGLLCVGYGGCVAS